MTSDQVIDILVHVIVWMIGIGGIVVVLWFLYHVMKFVRAALDIHYRSSARSYGHKIPLFNMLDSRVLSSKEKLLRAQALGNLGPFLLVFFIFFVLVVILSFVTS